VSISRAASLFAAATITAATAGGALVFAAPAAAGCETNLLGALYCDSPARADGTWDRCYTVNPTVNVFGQVTVPGAQKCYPVNPAEPWPLIPMGQPQYHIYP
jgi:hypothetical protein